MNQAPHDENRPAGPSARELAYASCASTGGHPPECCRAPTKPPGGRTYADLAPGVARELTFPDLIFPDDDRVAPDSAFVGAFTGALTARPADLWDSPFRGQ